MPADATARILETLRPRLRAAAVLALVVLGGSGVWAADETDATSEEARAKPLYATPLLRRELRHVADMLDPAFGDEPHLPAGSSRTHEPLLRDRYRTAWSATIDGHLVRAGKLDTGARERPWAEFAAIFGTLDVAAPAALFDNPPNPCAPPRPGDDTASGRDRP
jgi:hypothetical protein